MPSPPDRIRLHRTRTVPSRASDRLPHRLPHRHPRHQPLRRRAPSKPKLVVTSSRASRPVAREPERNAASRSAPHRSETTRLVPDAPCPTTSDRSFGTRELIALLGVVASLFAMFRVPELMALPIAVAPLFIAPRWVAALTPVVVVACCLFNRPLFWGLSGLWLVYTSCMFDSAKQPRSRDASPRVGDLGRAT